MAIRVHIDLEIAENTTYNKTFRWYTTVDRTPVDLTGYTGVMTIREKLTSASALLSIPAGGTWSADTTTGIYIYDQTDDDDIGKYRIYINDTDTTGICTAHTNISGIYDLLLTSADSEVVFQQYGICNIYASPTWT